jgi:hypothetical protein
MTDYNIGPGVAQAIADNGDEARSDERYVILDEGSRVSLTLGRDAQYWYYEFDNKVNRLPFGDGAEEEPLFDPWTSQPGQLYDWTCSACSLNWLQRATGLIVPADIYTSRESTVYEIGYTHNINAQVGLTNADGSALRAVLDNYGMPTDQGWLDFDTTYELASETPGMMSGAKWYHWVGIRGVDSGCIWVANSAPGYKGVYDHVSREQFAALGGFSVVWLV